MTPELREELVWWIASYLDQPHLYLGGPTPPSMRKAGEILDIVERVTARAGQED